MESESGSDVDLMKTYVLVGIILLRKLKIEKIDSVLLNKEVYWKTQNSQT